MSAGMDELQPRSSFDLRAAWIVFWRVRSTVYHKGRPVRWWQGWRTTFRAWWMHGHGKWLVS